MFCKRSSYIGIFKISIGRAAEAPFSEAIMWATSSDQTAPSSFGAAGQRSGMNCLEKGTGLLVKALTQPDRSRDGGNRGSSQNLHFQRFVLNGLS